MKKFVAHVIRAIECRAGVFFGPLEKRSPELAALFIRFIGVAREQARERRTRRALDRCLPAITAAPAATRDSGR